MSVLEEKEQRISEEKSQLDLSRYLLFLRHKKAYLFAGTKEYCQDKRVLDYGCGNGYGSFLLAKVARKVTAVDIDPTAIEDSRQKYRAENLSFELIAPEIQTNFADRSFDLIVSFQVIEHILDVKKYLNELKRMLSDKGVLIITTPNRRYRLYPFQKPVNPCHIREYNLKTFSKQLGSIFPQVTIFGITGTEEIIRIERKRLKKSVVNAFLRYPLKRMIISLAPRLLKKRKNISKEEIFHSTQEAENLSRFTVDDYKIIAENPDTGLDFMALLKKS